MVLRIFGLSFLVTVASLVVALLYGGPTALVLCAILGILEVSLSFDNAVINATILQRMSEFWQRMFLTIGILIAVFGMRLVFPLAIVWVTAGLNPVEAFDLALNPPPGDAAYFPNGDPSYETLLTDAHPQIAAFGGMFLALLFLNFIFAEREITWLSWLERPLARAGKLDMLSVVVMRRRPHPVRGVPRRGRGPFDGAAGRSARHDHLHRGRRPRLDVPRRGARGPVGGRKSHR